MRRQRRIKKAISERKQLLDWENASCDAREWWEELETLNRSDSGLVLRLCSELVKRKATIEQFYTAYLYGQTESIEDTLSFLDVIIQDREAEAWSPYEVPSHSYIGKSQKKPLVLEPRYLH